MSIPAPIDQGSANARCGDCDHVWIAAYLPMPLERAAELLKVARCPRGCTGKVFCG